MSKVRNRIPRLITGTLIPVVIFALIVAPIIGIGVALPPLPDQFGSLPGLMSLILAGWLLAGFQCFMFSLFMEFVINPTILNQPLIICISGLIISLITLSVFVAQISLPLLVIGFITGCATGCLLQDMYKYYG